MKVGSAVLAALVIAGTTTFADAANRHVDIVNNTGMSLTHFYASRTGTRDWEEDILGKAVVENGETFDINIDDGTGSCKFDFKAVFESGAESIKNNIDVCEISTFTYTR